ncbi:MAG TPA: ABC transporter substrate-binding protein [Pseudonocardiaceae bacterium]|nr:ABC transporter substrate-binding protein [Pseudonocardiaceae bacterium]
MRQRRAWLCALVLAVPLALTACSSGGNGATTQAGGGGGQTISVAVSGSENPIFAPYLVANAKGYFASRGITIKQDIYESGTLAFSAFAGGSDQFCICGATQVMTANSKGRGYVGVFNQYIGGAVVFVGAKKFESSRGTDLAKYNGATWAYTAEGSVSQVFMARAADAAGIGWDKQKHLAIGAVSAFIPSLQTGRADIVAMDSASAAQAIKAGIGYAVFNTNDPRTVQPIWGRQLGLPMVTTKAYASKNAALTQKFVDALRQGLVAVQANSADPNKVLALMPQDFQSSNKDTFGVIWPLVKAGFGSLDGTFTQQQLGDTTNFAIATGVLPKGTSTAADFDNTYAQKAISEVNSK